MHVQLLLYDGFRELDALGVWEVLQRAEGPGGSFRVRPVRMKSATVTSANGLQLHVSQQLEPKVPPDLLLLPGGGWVARAAPGSWAESQRAAIGAVAAELHRAGVRLAGIGSGALFPAVAGLLVGCPAATTPEALDELRACGAVPVGERVVEAGTIATAGGATAGLDLGLWLVERHAGAELAGRIRRELGLPPSPPRS